MSAARNHNKKLDLNILISLLLVDIMQEIIVTCALALFISSLVKQEKFLAGMEGAYVFATMQFVFAGLPTTNTYNIQAVSKDSL